MAGEKHQFRKNGRDLFLRLALERGDRIEGVREIGFSAQVISGSNGVRGRCPDQDCHGDLPDAPCPASSGKISL
jgi:hypothetical protein